MAEAGLRIGCPIEREAGVHHDLLLPAVQRLVLGWVRSRRAWLVHIGVPCSRWSIARSTGGPDESGLRCALFAIRVLRACRQAGVLFTIENPRSSRVWSWPPLAAELRRAQAVAADFPLCAFGTPFKKPTRFAGTLPGLGALTRECTCTDLHPVVLQGRVRLRSGRTCWLSSLGGAYPPRLSRAFAELAVAAAPSSAHRRSAEPRLDERWERAMAAAARAPLERARGAPTCPRRYVCPFRGAEPLWGVVRFPDKLKGRPSPVARPRDSRAPRSGAARAGRSGPRAIGGPPHCDAVLPGL